MNCKGNEIFSTTAQFLKEIDADGENYKNCLCNHSRCKGTTMVCHNSAHAAENLLNGIMLVQKSEPTILHFQVTVVGKTLVSSNKKAAHAMQREPLCHLDTCLEKFLRFHLTGNIMSFG